MNTLFFGNTRGDEGRKNTLVMNHTFCRGKVGRVPVLQNEKHHRLSNTFLIPTPFHSRGMDTGISEVQH